jgi:hypothetical protein
MHALVERVVLSRKTQDEKKWKAEAVLDGWGQMLERLRRKAMSVVGEFLNGATSDLSRRLQVVEFLCHKAPRGTDSMQAIEFSQRGAG